MTAILLLVIRIYQRTLSPLLGNCCRFEPSCSRYTAFCIEHWGPFRGTVMGLRRLLRCNPLFAGGIDLPPLPEGVDARVLEPNWARVVATTSCSHTGANHAHSHRPGIVQ